MKRKAKVLFVQKVSSTDYKVLLGRRISSNESFWWIPGGSVEKGESDFEAGLRELEEELFLTHEFNNALNIFKFSNTVPAVIEYQSPQSENIIFLVPIVNQSQIPIPAIKDEFEELNWFDFNNLPKNMSREFSYIEHQLQAAVKNV